MAVWCMMDLNLTCLFRNIMRCTIMSHYVKSEYILKGEMTRARLVVNVVDDSGLDPTTYTHILGLGYKIFHFWNATPRNSQRNWPSVYRVWSMWLLRSFDGVCGDCPPAKSLYSDPGLSPETVTDTDIIKKQSEERPWPCGKDKKSTNSRGMLFILISLLFVWIFHLSKSWFLCSQQ